MNKFKIRPILGRKTDVPMDDPGLFRFIKDDEALTHDVGGINFDLGRKHNSCTRSNGYITWSNSETFYTQTMTDYTEEDTPGRLSESATAVTVTTIDDDEEGISL